MILRRDIIFSWFPIDVKWKVLFQQKSSTICTHRYSPSIIKLHRVLWLWNINIIINAWFCCAAYKKCHMVHFELIFRFISLCKVNFGEVWRRQVCKNFTCSFTTSNIDYCTDCAFYESPLFVWYQHQKERMA